jgi:glycosyltransferase involved in cell wall biosynthesis
VSISNSQRIPLLRANWLATVAHGLPPERYTFTGQPARPYLAFLGRMSPEKRPNVAVGLALRARVPLRLAAKIDATDILYFEQVIQPMLKNPLIEFVGEIDESDKAAFLGEASALLFPIDWPEPFGLVMIEAMACARLPRCVHAPAGRRLAGPSIAPACSLWNAREPAHADCGRVHPTRWHRSRGTLP